VKDFDRWLVDSTHQAREEIEGRSREPDFYANFNETGIHFFVRCAHCGKREMLSYREYEDGGKGWYIPDHEAIEEMETSEGLCGGGPGCTP
jgi:hypothetical protein